MPTSTERPQIRRRRKRWLLAALITAAGAGLGSWLILRPPGLPVHARLAGSKGHALAFSPDGSILATEHTGGDVQLWDPATGRLRSTLRHHRPMILDAVFSPDARMLAVRGSDLFLSVCTITVFEVETGREVIRCDLPGSIHISPMWFTPDGSSLNGIRWDTTPNAPVPIHLLSWDTATGGLREDRPLPLKPKDVLAFTKDGRTFATGDRSTNTVTLLDAASGQELTSIVAGSLAPSSVFWTLGFSRDDGTLWIGKTEGDLELWDLGTRNLRARLPGPSPGYSTQTVVFGPGRDQILSWGMNRSIPSGPALFMVMVRSLFQPRGAGRGARDMPPSEVVIWDINARRPRMHLRGEAWPLLSPDGKILATAGAGGAITLWDVASESHP